MNLLDLLFGKPKERDKPGTAVDFKNNLMEGIKSLDAGASKISAWALSITGGTLLIVLNKDYSTPDVCPWRLIYLLFIIGWSLFGICLYKGKKITGGAIAADLHRDDQASLQAIHKNCNHWHGEQLRYFNLGLLVFGIWLMLYMAWWVFINVTPITTCK